MGDKRILIKNGKPLIDSEKKLLSSSNIGGIYPSGEIDIESNGEYDVTNYASANVNVPIPSDYIKPTGTIEITENGQYDVSNYASANVNVESGGSSEDLIVALNNDTLTSYSNNNIIKVRNYMFYQSYSLENVELSIATEIGEKAFYQCHKLKSITVPLVKNLGNSVFGSCYPLIKVLIEQTDAICRLSSTGTFSSCYHILGKTNSTHNPNGDKDGYIYVPASRLAEYKVATNWASVETQIIGHQDFNVGDTLPSYANDTYTTCTWYSNEELTQVVTSVTTQGRYYCRLEA